MAAKKKAAPAAKATAKKGYKETWRPTTPGSEGPKKSMPAKQYKNTMRPTAPGSEGPKKSMPRTVVKRTIKKK